VNQGGRSQGGRSRLAVYLTASIGAFALLPAAAGAATITVNDVGDTVADDGDCVLREAIEAANVNAASGAMAGECAGGEASPTVDTIDFSIAGGGPHTIAPATALPTLLGPVTIDGGLTDPNVIILDGAGAPSTAAGLRLEGLGGHTVRRLAIINFGGAGVDTGFFVPGNTIELNRIGTNFNSAAGLGNREGVLLDGDSNTVSDNVISGNEDAGVSVFTGGENTIVGNRIGTNNAGSAALANGVGIELIAADANVIGGAAEADANVISGNSGDGVEFIGGDGNRILGNLIGTDGTGQSDLGNGVQGIDAFSATGTVIGSDAGAEGNLISGNGTNGVLAGSGTVIDGNLIGINADGDAALGNGLAGVAIDGADTTVGTSAGGNVISGQDGPGDAGVLVQLGGAGTGVVIEGNRIGTTEGGLSAVPNERGISVAGRAEGLEILDNLISGNDSDGVVLDGTTSSALTGTVIQGNQIGNAIDGAQLGNGGHALSVAEAENTLVGGTAPEDANLLNSSGLAGVLIGANTPDAALLGNRINLNDELGINLLGGTEDGFGVTENDPGDPDAGANDLQNYPALSGAVAAGDQTAVTGELDSEADASYRLEFFTTLGGEDPSGHGEGVIPLGSTEVTTDASGIARFSASLDAETDPGDPVTATATKLSTSGEPVATSEFAENFDALACDVTGSENDDPALAGTGADEVICGLGGDDVIDPGGGDDIVVGGDGVDELDLSAATAAAEVDLAAGEGSVGGDGLGITGIEDVRGTDFADVLTGDGAENTFAGRAGGDELDGGEKADTLKGGDDRDTLRGKAGADDLRGQEGIDELVGGDAGDDLDGGDSKEDDLKGNAGKDSFDGGAGGDDSCNGGDNKDETPAPGCEIVQSIP
jgi:CSLREA domain-containing protein